MTLEQDILLEIGFIVYPTGDVKAGTDAFMKIRDATPMMLQIKRREPERQPIVVTKTGAAK